MIILLLLIFFVFRIIFLFVLGTMETSWDDNLFDGYARIILSDFAWLKNDNFFGSTKEPFYPIVVAAIYQIFGVGNHLAVYFFQIVLNCATIYFIYRIARRIFDERTALIAFLWSGMYYLYYFYCTELRRETLICFLIVLLVYTLTRFFHESKIGLWIPALFYTLLVHTDSRYLYLLPCLVILFLIFGKAKLGMRNAAVFILIAVLFSMPWTVRNYVLYNRAVPISMFYFEKDKNLAEGFRYNALMRRMYSAVQIHKGKNTRGNQKKVKFNFWKGRLNNFQEMFAAYRLKGYYRPSQKGPQYYKAWSLKHNIVSVLNFGILLPFFVAGIVRSILKNNKYSYLLIMPFVFHAGIHTLIWGNERYRLPVDFVIIIIAGYGISETINWLKKARHYASE